MVGEKDLEKISAGEPYEKLEEIINRLDFSESQINEYNQKINNLGKHRVEKILDETGVELDGVYDMRGQGRELAQDLHSSYKPVIDSIARRSDKVERHREIETRSGGDCVPTQWVIDEVSEDIEKEVHNRLKQNPGYNGKVDRRKVKHVLGEITESYHSDLGYNFSSLEDIDLEEINLEDSLYTEEESGLFEDQGYELSGSEDYTL